MSSQDARDTNGNHQFLENRNYRYDGGLSTIDSSPLLPSFNEDLKKTGEASENNLRGLGQSRIKDLLSNNRYFETIESYNMMTSERDGLYMVELFSQSENNPKDIMEMLRMENDSSFSDTMNDLCRNIFKFNGKVLYHAKMNSSDFPESLCVNSMTLNDFNNSYPRKFCYLSYGIYFSNSLRNELNKNYRQVGAHIWESIAEHEDNVSSFPGVNESSFLQCGILVRSVDDEDSNMRSNISFYIKQEASSNKVLKWMKKFATIVHNLNHAVLCRQVVKMDLIGRAQWENGSDCCFICRTSLKVRALKRKHHCRLCGNVLCSKCKIEIVVNSVQFGGSKEILMCKNLCFRIHASQTENPNCWQVNKSLWHEDFISGEIDNSKCFLDMCVSNLESYVNYNTKLSTDELTTKVLYSVDYLVSLHENLPANDFVDSFSSIPSSNQSPRYFENNSMYIRNTVLPEHLHIKTENNGLFIVPKAVNEHRRVVRARGLYLIDDTGMIQLLVEAAATVFHCETCYVSIIGQDSAFIISKIGLDYITKGQNIEFRRQAILDCITIASVDPTIVLDAHQHDEISKSVLVVNNLLSFYVGIPLVTSDDFIVGALSIVRTRPKLYVLRDKIAILTKIAHMIIKAIEANTSFQDEL